jgi:3-oxoacyl-[acyl-carrier protein] reductase
MDLGLKGKVAMVAGASKGLGYAVAHGLASEGVKVSMSSRNEFSITDAGKRISAETFTETITAAVDVRSAKSIASWHTLTMEKLGGVDLLFVNSGGPPAGPVLSFDDEGWKGAFELLVLSAVRMVRLAAPSMKARGGGAIVVSTSSAVKEPVANLALSNVVRSSTAALSKTLANELAADKIRVNHLLPGRIDTDRVRELDVLRGKSTGASAADVKVSYEKAIPLGRYGDATEYANAAVFLFSDAARYITGASLQVDGGMIRSAY